MQNEVAIRETTMPTNGAFTMTPRSLEEAMRFADIMASSDLVPQAYKGKPGNILVAIQKGYEIGMTPMNALESIAVINGRATLWGDGMLALVQSSPVYEWIDESESTNTVGVCISKRKGHKPLRTEFTLEDAKRAGLLGKPGPWQQYQPRMLKLRARGFNLRDNFADVTKGMISAEEAMDIPPVTTTGEFVPEEAPKPLTLKDKLKQQVEETAAPPESAPPAESAPTPVDSGSGPSPVDDPADPMHPDNLCEDFRRRIKASISQKEAIGQLQQARELGCFMKSHLDGLTITLNERLQELGKKK